MEEEKESVRPLKKTVKRSCRRMDLWCGLTLKGQVRANGAELISRVDDSLAQVAQVDRKVDKVDKVGKVDKVDKVKQGKER